MIHHRRRYAALMLLCGLLAGLLTSPTAHAGPARYSLAIGDSVPYGVVNGTPGSGARFTSFVDRLQQRLQTPAPGHQAVNYSCPRATTASVIGPAASACQGIDQYDPHSGSQLDAARTFLARHPGAVSPILVSVGGNDLLTDVNLDTMQARAGQIVAALRAAAPTADLVVTGYGDPLSLGKAGQAARYDEHAAFNARLRAVAATVGATFIDPHPVFNAPPEHQDAAICTYLLACNAGDVHPTGAGHDVYTDLIWSALSYGALPAAPPLTTPSPAPTSPPTAETSTMFGTPSSPGARVALPEEGEVLGARAVAPARFAAPRMARNRRSLRLWMRCAPHRTQTCRIRVVVRQGKRTLGTARVRLKPGRTAMVRVRFRRRAAKKPKVRVSAFLGRASRPTVRLTTR